MYYFIPAATISANTTEVMTRVAQLQEVEGDVFIKRGGGLREFPAFEGMSLMEGDWLRTEENSSVEIAFADGTESKLGSYTQVYISHLTEGEEASQASIKVWSGQMWNKVKRLFNVDDEFEVETPTAIMGVRGTMFLTYVDPASKDSRLSVIDGVVAHEPLFEVVKEKERWNELKQDFEKEGKQERLEDLVQQMNETYSSYYDTLQKDMENHNNNLIERLKNGQNVDTILAREQARNQEFMQLKELRQNQVELLENNLQKQNQLTEYEKLYIEKIQQQHEQARVALEAAAARNEEIVSYLLSKSKNASMDSSNIAEKIERMNTDLTKSIEHQQVDVANKLVQLEKGEIRSNSEEMVQQGEEITVDSQSNAATEIGRIDFIRLVDDLDAEMLATIVVDIVTVSEEKLRELEEGSDFADFSMDGLEDNVLQALNARALLEQVDTLLREVQRSSKLEQMEERIARRGTDLELIERRIVEQLIKAEQKAEEAMERARDAGISEGRMSERVKESLGEGTAANAETVIMESKREERETRQEQLQNRSDVLGAQLENRAQQLPSNQGPLQAPPGTTPVVTAPQQPGPPTPPVQQGPIQQVPAPTPPVQQPPVTPTPPTVGPEQPPVPTPPVAPPTTPVEQVPQPEQPVLPPSVTPTPTPPTGGDGGTPPPTGGGGGGTTPPPTGGGGGGPVTPPPAAPAPVARENVSFPVSSASTSFVVAPSSLVANASTSETYTYVGTPQSNNTNVATVSIQNSQLVVTPVNPGTAVITIEVANSSGEKVAVSFTVNVEAEEIPFTEYFTLVIPGFAELSQQVVLNKLEADGMYSEEHVDYHSTIIHGDLHIYIAWPNYLNDYGIQTSLVENYSITIRTAHYLIQDFIPAEKMKNNEQIVITFDEADYTSLKIEVPFKSGDFIYKQVAVSLLDVHEAPINTLTIYEGVKIKNGVYTIQFIGVDQEYGYSLFKFGVPVKNGIATVSFTKQDVKEINLGKAFDKTPGTPVSLTAFPKNVFQSIRGLYSVGIYHLGDAMTKYYVSDLIYDSISTGFWYTDASNNVWSYYYDVVINDVIPNVWEPAFSSNLHVEHHLSNNEVKWDNLKPYLNRHDFSLKDSEGNRIMLYRQHDYSHNIELNVQIRQGNHTSNPISFADFSKNPDKYVSDFSGNIEIIFTPVASPFPVMPLTLRVLLDEISIIAIEDLEVIVTQGDEYFLPTEISALMSDGNYQRLQVSWDPALVNTSEPGKQIFTGMVVGYDEIVTLHLTVKEKGQVPYTIEIISVTVDEDRDSLYYNPEIGLFNSNGELIAIEEIGLSYRVNILDGEDTVLRNTTLGEFRLLNFIELFELYTYDLYIEFYIETEEYTIKPFKIYELDLYFLAEREKEDCPFCGSTKEVKVDDVTANSLMLSWENYEEYNDIRIFINDVLIKEIYGPTNSYLVNDLEAETNYHVEIEFRYSGDDFPRAVGTIVVTTEAQQSGQPPVIKSMLIFYGMFGSPIEIRIDDVIEATDQQERAWFTDISNITSSLTAEISEDGGSLLVDGLGIGQLTLEVTNSFGSTEAIIYFEISPGIN